MINKAEILGIHNPPLHSICPAFEYFGLMKVASLPGYTDSGEDTSEPKETTTTTETTDTTTLTSADEDKPIGRQRNKYVLRCYPHGEATTAVARIPNQS